MESDSELGIIGLGKIGGNLAQQAVEKDIRVIGLDTVDKPELGDKGVVVVNDYDEFITELNPPRAIYLSIPAGPTVDDIIRDLRPRLDAGDVLMDGGNSFFRDSMRRAKQLQEDNIHFIDVGTSGGVGGARNGACFMIGGREPGVELVEPLLEELSVDGGYAHIGGPGSGHFIKLVHNGIEFGMLQAIGEGVELIKASEFDADLATVFHNWSNGSVIRGWLVELMAAGLDDQEFGGIPNYVEDTGEVNWLVQEAVKSETPIPVISQAVMELFKSRNEQSEAYRAIALMRHGFGGHPFGEDETIAEEREISRIEGI
jgi:6-phosphogluconate dehydrogenase